MNSEMKRRYEEKIYEIQNKMLNLFSDLNDLYFDYSRIEEIVKKDKIFSEWYKEYMMNYKKISELFNNFDNLYNKLIDMKILKSKDLK